MTEGRENKEKAVLSAFSEHEGPLKSFIGRFLMRPHDVDDIAQETFIRAFRAQKKREIEHPRAYLYKIAKNLALKELTKKSNRMTSYIEDSCPDGTLESPHDVERHIEVREKLDKVKKAISNLPPQCQRVFIMRKVYGFSHKEIASQLGISISTVEKHIVSGLKRCRESVRKQETPSSLTRFTRKSMGSSGGHDVR